MEEKRREIRCVVCGVCGCVVLTCPFFSKLPDIHVRSPISVLSPVFPWIVEHATDTLNKCLVASDGKSAYERLKRRQHRGMLLPFGTAVMFRVAGKVPGGVMTERWHLGTRLGKRFHTEEHIVARKGRWPCDQIKGGESDAWMIWARSRAFRGPLWSFERCTA